MFKYLAPSFVIMNGVAHLFCCGIPLALSVTGLAAAWGIFSGAMFEVAWFEVMEWPLMVVSGVVLAATIIAQAISRKVNCYEDVDCCDAPCNSRKSFDTYLLMGAGLLYLANLVTVFIA